MAGLDTLNVARNHSEPCPPREQIPFRSTPSSAFYKSPGQPHVPKPRRTLLELLRPTVDNDKGKAPALANPPLACAFLTVGPFSMSTCHGDGGYMANGLDLVVSKGEKKAMIIKHTLARKTALLSLRRRYSGKAPLELSDSLPLEGLTHPSRHPCLPGLHRSTGKCGLAEGLRVLEMKLYAQEDSMEAELGAYASETNIVQNSSRTGKVSGQKMTLTSEVEVGAERGCRGDREKSAHLAHAPTGAQALNPSYTLPGQKYGTARHGSRARAIPNFDPAAQNGRDRTFHSLYPPPTTTTTKHGVVAILPLPIDALSYLQPAPASILPNGTHLQDETMCSGSFGLGHDEQGLYDAAGVYCLHCWIHCCGESSPIVLENVKSFIDSDYYHYGTRHPDHRSTASTATDYKHDDRVRAHTSTTTEYEHNDRARARRPSTSTTTEYEHDDRVRARRPSTSTLINFEQDDPLLHPTSMRPTHKEDATVTRYANKTCVRWTRFARRGRDPPTIWTSHVHTENTMDTYRPDQLLDWDEIISAAAAALLDFQAADERLEMGNGYEIVKQFGHPFVGVEIYGGVAEIEHAD
ncbi:hypothetical protein BDZ89DRAFT_1051896 [Hymenopellis radicata]|nr:hypothetical protein BDZ89DRAFT_1051896 [Hymenopellis radicata]